MTWHVLLSVDARGTVYVATISQQWHWLESGTHVRCGKTCDATGVGETKDLAVARAEALALSSGFAHDRVRLEVNRHYRW